MICRSRAALRLSFAGGGTELSPYLEAYGGQVLNATITMFAYATIFPRSDNKVEFTATDLGRTETLDAGPDIALRGALPLHRGVYARIMRTMNRNEFLPVTVVTSCDAPMGSGLGASSTITVALIKAFDEMLGLSLGQYELAHLAYEIERNDLQLSGGRQDQYAAAFGGFNFMEFLASDRVIINPLRVHDWIRSELEASLLLCFTGTSRDSAQIIDEQTRGLQRSDGTTVQSLHRMKAYAAQLKEDLLKGRINRIADVLNEGWMEKRRTAHSVSNERIDRLYQIAIEAGALGGKISGAGGGGFMMLIVDPTRRQYVSNALQAEGATMFSCCFHTEGAQSWRRRDG
jgi:D-glycero-alpha-D-manno-heptose-7-phosphate kinase